jgi:hypothetical protein
MPMGQERTAERSLRPMAVAKARYFAFSKSPSDFRLRYKPAAHRILGRRPGLL